MNRRILFSGVSLAFVATLAVAAPPPGQVAAGYDRTNSKQQTIATDSLGRLLVVGSAAGSDVYGPDADGTPPTQPPVLNAGFDGTNVQTQLTDTSGRQRVVGAGASGAAAAGDPVGVGCVYLSAPLTLTNGQRGDCLVDTRQNFRISVVDGNGTAAVVANSAGDASAQQVGLWTVSTQRVWNGSSWDRLNAYTNMPSNGLGVPSAGLVGQMLTTRPTLANGEYGRAQLDTRANLRVSLIDGDGTASLVLGNNAEAASQQSGAWTIAGNRVFNGSTWDRWQSVQGASGGAGLGVGAIAEIPNSSANIAITPAVSTAAEGSKVFKASAGNLYRINVTTGAVSGYLMVFNATSAPADGAVTPLLCRPVGANSSVEVDHSKIPDRYSTGITAVFSTTGCFTKTVSATAMFEGSYQ